MKKKFYAIFLVFVSVFLFGCNQKDKDSNKLLTNWPIAVRTMIEDNYNYEIPFYNKAKEYYADLDGDNNLILHCILDEKTDSNEVLEEYSTICDNKNWQVDKVTKTYFNPADFTNYDYDVYYAHKEYNEELGLALEFLAGNYRGDLSLDIICSKYVPINTTMWPTDLIQELLGITIPSFEKEEFRYVVSTKVDEMTDDVYIYITITNATYEDELAYKEILENAGYLIFETDNDITGNFAVDLQVTHCIQYKYNEGYGLELFIYNL